MTPTDAVFTVVIGAIVAGLFALAWLAEAIGNWLWGPEPDHWMPGDRPSTLRDGRR